MGSLLNTFDGGAAGSSITNGNSGGTNGDAFSLTGDSRVYTADAVHGALGALFTQAPGAASNYAAWAWAEAADGTLQLYLVLLGTPDTTMPIVTWRASGSTVMQLTIGTDRGLNVLNATSGLLKGFGALTVGTIYRVDVGWIVGTTTANGQVDVDVYTGESTTPVEAGLHTTTANIGTAPIDGVRIGQTATNSGSASRAIRFDSPRVRFGEGKTYYAPFGINQAPTVTLTPPQTVAPSATFTATAVPADADGTVSEFAWDVPFPTVSPPALTGAAAATVNGPAPAAGGSLVLLRCTVTDDDGATGEATTEIRVPLTGSTEARPLPMDATKTGTWTRTGAATTDGAALADSSDTTYLQSGEVSGTAQALRSRVQPRTALASGAVQLRLGLDVAGSALTTVRLYEGAVLRQTWTQTLTSTTPQDFTFTISAPGAIGDWGALHVDVAVTAA